MRAQILVHQTVKNTRVVELCTGLKARWIDDRKQRKELVPEGEPVPMGIIVINAQREFARGEK